MPLGDQDRVYLSVLADANLPALVAVHEPFA